MQYNCILPGMLDNENLYHFIKCFENKGNRDEWKKYLGNKIERILQHEKSDEVDKLIVKEILKDANKHFNNEDNYYANQHLIGYEGMFRGVIEKD